MSTTPGASNFRLRAVCAAFATATLAAALTVFRADALPPAIDLDQCPADPSQCAGLTVYGDSPMSWSGHSVTAGDINGDGADDLIIGAPLAAPDGRVNAGETYVIYGGATLPGTIDLDSTSAGLTIYGSDAGDLFGDSVAAGDINGDDIDDLIIGALYGDGSGSGTSCGPGQVGNRCFTGETYVFYGGPSLPSVIDLNGASADLTVYGDNANDNSTISLAAGDINGDGFEDVIIGAEMAHPAGGANAGQTYVIYGGPALPGTIDLDSTSADLTVHGDDTGDLSGDSVAAGDIDGDGIDDLIIGAFGADGSGTGTDCPQGGGDRCLAGETYVIYGGPGLPATIDLNDTSADLTVLGRDAGDGSGVSVAAGDIDGDGTDDLIIGAYAANPSGRDRAGETYVIYGGDSLPATIDLNSASAGLVVFGDDAVDGSGFSVTAGDVDGDTTDDLIIGANYADAAGGTDAGETYVVYGGPGLPATIDLARTSPDLVIYGDDAEDMSGISVAAGDIDGDGTDDLIIGAFMADPGGRDRAGATYVIYGSPRPVPPPTPTPCPPDGCPTLVGDVDCSGTVNSVDAMLILQFAAGLIVGSLPCVQGADASGDGAIDPIDAALILQYDAGLIGSLPP